MAASKKSTVAINDVVAIDDKELTGLTVVSRGRKGKKRTAMIIIYRKGAVPRTRHLIEQPNKGFTDEQGRIYDLPRAL